MASVSSRMDWRTPRPRNRKSQSWCRSQTVMYCAHPWPWVTWKTRHERPNCSGTSMFVHLYIIWPRNLTHLHILGRGVLEFIHIPILRTRDPSFLHFGTPVWPRATKFVRGRGVFLAVLLCPIPKGSSVRNFLGPPLYNHMVWHAATKFCVAIKLDKNKIFAGSTTLWAVIKIF